jgi:hypothetical protein
MNRCALPLTALALTLTLIGGCATAPSSAITVCPKIVEYSKETLAAAADELDSLQPDAVLREMMKDYASERDQLRKCQ